VIGRFDSGRRLSTDVLSSTPDVSHCPAHLHKTCTRAEHFCTSSVHDHADHELVDANWEQNPFLSVGRRRYRRPSLEDRLIARMLAPWLDRELADGLGGSLSEAHAARADQLSSEHARRALARLLDRLVDRAQEPSRAFPHLFIVPCQDQVQRAMPAIDLIRSRLHSAEPLDPRAMAQLKTLLSERTGPCYAPSEPDALKVALEELSASLTVERPHAAWPRSRSSESDPRRAA
jgi:hypothetical protein